MSSLRPTVLAALTALAPLAACEPALDAPSVTYPGMTAHARYLPLVGTPHEPSTSGPTRCESCHTTETFTQFTCTSTACHGQVDTDAIHTGLAGYAYASATCYGCHKDGTAAPPNHTPDFFPIGAGTAHAGVRCSQCHTDRTAPRDPRNYACASCHAGLAGFSTAHAIAGYAILSTKSGENAAPVPLPGTSDYCLRCHADSQVNRVASHPRDEEGFGQSDHRLAGCLTCHTQLRTDKPFGARFSSEGGCTTCHSGGTGDD